MYANDELVYCVYNWKTLHYLKIRQILNSKTKWYNYLRFHKIVSGTKNELPFHCVSSSANDLHTFTYRLYQRRVQQSRCSRVHAKIPYTCNQNLGERSRAPSLQNTPWYQDRLDQVLCWMVNISTSIYFIS